MQEPLKREMLQRVHLKPERISLHARRVQKALNKGIHNHTVSITKPCTVSNSGIMILKPVVIPKDFSSEKTLCLFPAAGAAARFFADLFDFIEKIESKAPNIKTLTHAGQIPSAQICQQLNALVIPEHIKRLIQEPSVKTKDIKLDTILECYKKCCELTEKYSALPKALLPATLEGDSFLKLKFEEQLNIFAQSNNVIIVPFLQKSLFEQELTTLQNHYSTIIKKPLMTWDVYEQGPDLNTIRFRTTGEPFVDDQGGYSTVAAGHGELIHLFPKIWESHKKTTCLHIRNIDNIVGTHKQTTQELQKFELSFHAVHKHLQGLRTALSDTNSAACDPTHIKNHIKGIFNLFDNLKLPPLQKTQPLTEWVYNCMCKIFHWPDETNLLIQKNISYTDLLSNKLNRPLSLFGVVPKEKNDQGGGPVFAKLEDGAEVKICLEMPHASEADKVTYFGADGKCTHFNPVMVFFETGEGKCENLFDDRLWLLSKRQFQGQWVCYHETVLYELIGNSARANVIFVEMPRCLFHPNKSFFDSLGKGRQDHGFKPAHSTTKK